MTESAWGGSRRTAGILSATMFNFIPGPVGREATGSTVSGARAGLRRLQLPSCDIGRSHVVVEFAERVAPNEFPALSFDPHLNALKTSSS